MRENEGLYIISVAARLLEMHQQTLRKYERAGFIRPQRTGGNLRLYSVEDVERLRQIKYLVDELGMNLDGVETMLQLSGRLRRLYHAIAPGMSQDEASAALTEVAKMLALLGVDHDLIAESAPVASGERRGR